MFFGALRCIMARPLGTIREKNNPKLCSEKGRNLMDKNNAKQQKNDNAKNKKNQAENKNDNKAQNKKDD